MQIKAEEKIKPVTYLEALTALWRVRLWLGQYPIHIRLVEDMPTSEKRKGRV